MAFIAYILKCIQTWSRLQLQNCGKDSAVTHLEVDLPAVWRKKKTIPWLLDCTSVDPNPKLRKVTFRYRATQSPVSATVHQTKTTGSLVYKYSCTRTPAPSNAPPQPSAPLPATHIYEIHAHCLWKSESPGLGAQASSLSMFALHICKKRILR